MSEPIRPDIARVGFFHFGGRPSGRPVAQLRSCLSEKSKTTDFGDCMLVVPEAFNIAGIYSDARHEREIVDGLFDLSTKFKIAIVVGLMVDAERYGRWNTACLIDGDKSHILSGKIGQDLVGGYSTCCYFAPTRFRGQNFAALICMDSVENISRFCPDRAALQDLAQLWCTKLSKNLIMCVPAHFTTNTGKLPVDRWRNDCKMLVVSNSSTEHPSVIYANGQLVIHPDADPDVFAKHPMTYVSEFADIPKM